MTKHKKKMKERMVKRRKISSTANDAAEKRSSEEEPSKKKKTDPAQTKRANPEPSGSPSIETAKKVHENLMLLDKALDPSPSPSEKDREEVAVEAENEVEDEEGVDEFGENHAKKEAAVITWQADVVENGTNEDQENTRMILCSHPSARPRLPLLEHVGEAIAVLEELKQRQNAKRAICGKWQAFMAHVADLAKKKRRAAKLCIPRERYARILESSDPLPTQDLKRVHSLEYLVKVPAQNKRRTPPRLVPCVEDWVHVLAQTDEDSDHASNALGLYRAMQRKGFGVPGLEICQLWVDYCEVCKASAKQNAHDDPKYKHFLTRELVDRFRSGPSNLQMCLPT